MNEILDSSERERREFELRQFQTTINTSVPCKVIAVGGSTVDVELNILREFEGAAQPALQLLDVPVIFPGSGKISITFPISVGDTGLIIFSQRDIDNWLTDGDPVLPNTLRLHDYSDGIFLPGLRPEGVDIPDNTTITSGDVSIVMTTNGVEINNGLFDFVQLVTELTTILSTQVGNAGAPLPSNAAVLQVLAKMNTFTAP